MNIDFNEIHEHYDLLLSSRKKEDENDAKLRRFKDRYLFLATVILLCLGFSVCALIALLTFKNNPQLSSTALNGVIGIGLGMAGYYVKGKNN